MYSSLSGSEYYGLFELYKTAEAALSTNKNILMVQVWSKSLGILK